jgi:hypothetical protein
MQRLLSFYLALSLTMAPGFGLAEGLPGVAPNPPVHPPGLGFLSLFRSSAQAPPRSEATPPGEPPLTIMAAKDVAQRPGLLISTGAMCRAALNAAEAKYGIPAGLLQAIGVVESGRRDEATGRREPWPWTINAEGEPHVFDNKEQAVGWVRQAQARGMRSIDIGCGQVNLAYHPTAFASLEEAFEPISNADYAGRFLKELHDTSAGGNWMTAVGYYHSQTPELAEPYRQQVQAALSGSGGAGPLPAPSRGSGPTPPFGAPGIMQSMATARPEPARVPPVAVSGTAGRGLDAYRAAPIQMARILPPGFFRQR